MLQLDWTEDIYVDMSFKPNIQKREKTAAQMLTEVSMFNTAIMLY